MLDRQKGKLFFECDGCGEVLETEQSIMDDARRVFQDNGWSAQAVEGRGRQGATTDWKHYCPDCKGKE